MAFGFRTALVSAAFLGLAQAASASVLTFDDLPAGEAFFTSSYHGFNFGNNDPQTNPWFWSDYSPTPYTPFSSPTYVATDYTLYDGTPLKPTQAITSVGAVPFTFDGAYFAGFDTIEYQLSLGGNVVYTSSAPSAALSGTPIFVASGYAGQVDSVVIIGTQGYYVMDNFTYNTAAVPEPASLALVSVGLLGLGAAMRRRKA